MDWISKMQRQAQEAAEKLISSEAADKARQLAAQATQQAAAFAHQATIKAQEVAKEAIGEAEKSITALRHQGQAAPSSSDPMRYGITPELERFVCSLTYSTFSEYPLDSLDVPSAPEQQRLSSWQETHARLMLQRVQQLQDLRFVLCPKRMDEYMFWLIYFTLCKRYLPQQDQQTEAWPNSMGVGGAAAAAAAAGHAATAGVADSDADQTLSAAQQQQAASTSAGGALSPSESPAAAPTGTGVARTSSGQYVPDGAADTPAAGGADAEQEQEDLAELADDPELTAYLQDALQLDSKAADGDSGELGSDMDDLDDYLTQLDAEVNAPK